MDKGVGTYKTVRSKEFADFYGSVGCSKEICQKLPGTHWILKIWREGEAVLGHFICEELPELNTVVGGFFEGVGKMTEHPMFGFGGKSLYTLKQNRDGTGYVVTCETEKFGTILWEQIYTDDGTSFVMTGKGKTMTEIWERCPRIEGSYVFDREESLESYFRATGDLDMLSHMKDYKMHLCVRGKQICFSDFYGEMGKFSNCMDLNVEMPFQAPGDKEGEPPIHHATLKKTGVNKFRMIFRSRSGLVEEWQMCFSNWGLIMTGTEKNSGLSCKVYLRRFKDITGTFKMITMIGFEKFASAMGGMSADEAIEMTTDPTATLIISDNGSGFLSYKVMRRNFCMNLCFQMNKEFTYSHPILKEDVRAIATMLDDGLMCLTAHTSRGTILYKLTVTNSFATMSVSAPEAQLRYKVIYQKISY